MSLSEAITARIKNVQLAVFDVDGVMTDGSLVYGGGSTGEEMIKVFNTLDGHGMKMLQRSGVELAIISGRGCKALEKRAEHLGIKNLMQHVENKTEAYAQLLQRLGLTPSVVAGIGDDVVDLPILLHCGFSAAVPTAPAFVRERVHYVTKAHSGHGAVREFCEVIMAAQGTLDAALATYLV